MGVDATLRPMDPSAVSGLRGGALLQAVLALALLAACREGTGSAASSFDPIAPGGDGASGCNGPDQVFTLPVTPSEIALAALVIGPSSQVAAAQGSEVLYATGADGAIVALDFSAGDPPLESVLVAPGVLDLLLAGFGIAASAEPAGLAVLDAASLLVVERTSNVLLAVDRTTPDTVTLFAGFPSEVPGLADGPSSAARFSFGEVVIPTPAGDGRVFLADPGNHVLRVIDGGFVSTLAGAGTPFFADGDLFAAGFDTPVATSVTCGGELLLVELGAAGLGGQRLRTLQIGDPFFFGGFLGLATTLAGDGSAATIEGVGSAASLFAPVSVVSTSEGDVYWVDSGSGVLRRFEPISGVVDCPLDVDCAAAVLLPTFVPGSSVALAISERGDLFALDPLGGKLYRVTAAP